MADSPTTRNRLRKQEVGAKTNAWGADLNEDGGSDRLDESLDGVVAFTLSGSKTLTSTNYETDEARMRIINVTGGTGGTVTIPAVEKWYLVRNGSSGSVVISNGSNNVSVVSGEICGVFTNGTNVYKTNDKDYVDTAILNASLSSELPSQSGNAGKFIQTDGSNASWEDLEVADIFGLDTELATLQPLDADLTAIAALSPSNDDVIQRKAGAWTNRTMAQIYSDLGAAGLTAALATKAATGANTDITALDQDVAITESGTVAANSIGFRGLPASAQSPGSGITLGLADAGKSVPNTTGGWTIPANASVAFPVGTTIVLINNSGSSQNVAITSDTLRLSGTASTGTRALAQYGMATIHKVASATWIISGAGLS